MNRSKRVISMLLLLILNSPALLFGQGIEPEDVDSVFVEYMRSAWDEIRESDNQISDSLQRVYSDEFYEYYLQNRNTETGNNAFVQAFMMWGNTGKADKVHEALSTLDNNSHLWSKMIMYLGNVYYRNEELESETYHKLLDDLSTRLTHPESKSRVLLTLLRGSARENYTDGEAIEFARKLVPVLNVISY